MPADFRPDPEVSPDFLLHALLLAHFNAQQSGLRRRGLPHLGSPKILFLLMRYPEDGSSAPSQKELADLLRISPATVAASLKSLELCGYVTRHADEQDSRRNRISITAKGRQERSCGLWMSICFTASPLRNGNRLCRFTSAC